jgi:hypothetical protein
MTKALARWLIWLVMICCVSRADDQALVAHYAFDEGAGTAATDGSGNGNDGEVHGAVFVRSPEGHALRFDGVDDFVDCGASESLQQLEVAGTIAFWFKPEELRGGLVNWSTGSDWSDQRLIISYKVYHGATDFIQASADSRRHRERSLVWPAKNTWNHVAVTFDGGTVCYYLDGTLRNVFYQDARPMIAGVPLWLGRNAGLGPAYFKGVMDEVRIYRRMLSSLEVLASYKNQAAAFQGETKEVQELLIRAQAVPEPGWIAVETDFARLRPLPDSSALAVSVRGAAGSKALGRKVKMISPNVGSIIVKMDAADFSPGTYQVTARILDGEGKPVGKPSRESVEWPGQPTEFKGIKILNNVVWELLKLGQTEINGRRSFAFTSPKRRWIYVAATADATGGGISISVDDEKEIISFAQGQTATKEAMRFLPAGEHELIVSTEGAGQIKRLVIRSIPEILVHEFIGAPWSVELGMSAEDFRERYVMPSVNTFVIASSHLDHPFFKKWQASGRRWLAACVVPFEKDGKTYTAEQAYQQISSTAGFTNSLVHGSMADEDAGSYPASDAYAEAIQQLAANPEFKDRLFYSYEHIHALMGNDAFMKAITDKGSAIVWKRYLPTQSDELSARTFLKEAVVDKARKFRDAYPNVLERTAVCFGSFSSVGGHLLGTTPSVNHKVYLDMQYNIVANDPTFWGTYGLMLYHTSYSDEEILRWVCNLFRHYGIEGETKPATTDPYKSPHSANGDFVEGTNGWNITPAEPDSVRTVLKRGLSLMQTRYGSSAGENGLVTVRSAKEPNIITREITDLQPGRLYTFRMMTCDYENMSKEEKHAVSVKLENVSLIPGKSFSHLFHNPGWGTFPPYDGQKNKAWMNYHWYLFRAEGKTARMTITDWAGDDEPGGRIDQELMFNYIQVHPYYPAD